MEDKYRTLAAQIDNIYRDNETVDMNMVAKLIQSSVGITNPAEDKYDRASEKAIRAYLDGPEGCDIHDFVREAIKAEIERLEPLVPGVRYRNTEANRRRIPTVVDAITGTHRSVCVLVWESDDDKWPDVQYVIVDGPGFAADIVCFSIISDGKVQDE